MEPKTDPKIPDLVSLGEVGEILGISRQAAHKRLMRGEFAGRQTGGGWVFRRTVIERIREDKDRKKKPESHG